jgi:hypothetical protein
MWTKVYYLIRVKTILRKYKWIILTVESSQGWTMWQTWPVRAALIISQMKNCISLSLSITKTTLDMMRLNTVLAFANSDRVCYNSLQILSLLILPI